MNPRDEMPMISAIEGLLTSVPEMQDLQRAYAREKVASRSTDERLAWVRQHLNEELMADLRNEPAAEFTGIDADTITCAWLDDCLRTWTQTGKPRALTALLAPQIERTTLPDGSPVLVAIIHPLTELEPLFDAIRAAHAQTFAPFGIRATTVEDLGYVAEQIAKGLSQSEIAWEFVYRDHPHAALLDKKSRKVEYGDLHKTAYARVRWLKTKALDAVSKLGYQPSQESE